MWTVYKHTSPSGKSYIGITSQKVEYRWGKNGNGYKNNTLFWKAITKYGWDNLTHEVLADNLTEQDAHNLEQYYIKKYNSYAPNGYNLSLGGESGSYGYHHTEETKKIIAEAGRTGGFKGHKHTEESNELNRIKHLGRKNPHDDNWRKKVSKANTGKKRTPEQRARISESKKGIKHTEDTKRRIAETCKKKETWKSLFREDVVERRLANKCKRIGQFDANDNLIMEFKSITECAKYFNMSVANVSLIISGKRKKNVYNLRRI